MTLCHNLPEILLATGFAITILLLGAAIAIPMIRKDG